MKFLKILMFLVNCGERDLDDFTIGLIQFTDVTVFGASIGVRVRL